MKKRIDKLRGYMAEENLSSVIIKNLKNVHYFSGYTGTSAYLLITMDHLYLFTDFRYIQQSRSQCPMYEICDVSKEKIEDYLARCETTGFENLSISYNDYLELSKKANKLVPLGDKILEFRSVKDDEEISLIAKAEEIGDKAFEKLLSYAKDGMTEREIALFLEFHMKKLGAEGLSFDTIVASGVRGALPHGVATDKKIAKGELVTVDFGCVYNGYSSDMTRTFAVGDISDELGRIYETVLLAQTTSLDMIKSGVKASDVHMNALSIIQEKYPGSFGHGLGHGLGLDIHESPNLSPRNENMLKTGNVVTVEPGIYIPDVGGVRIEDVALVTENGCINLTKSPKNLIFI